LKNKFVYIVLLIISLQFPAFGDNNDKQILRGMVSVVRSMDTYMKGVYDYPGLNGENSEVNGDLYLCEYIAMHQYPSKADGYIRFYAKTGIPEYREVAQQFIDKMYKVYKETKDSKGQNWIPTQQFIAKDGKFYGYSKGPHFTRNTNSPIPFDQSQGKCMIEGAGFPDAWGIGMLELCKTASFLDDDHKAKLAEILYCMADFWNRDYMRYNKNGVFLYRTEDVEPLNPKPQINPPRWGYMASEVIYSVAALNELGKDTSRYDTNLILFLKTYVKERANHKDDARIDYLDSRMLVLSDYFKSKNKNADLTDWVYEKVSLLLKNKPYSAQFMLGGNSTTYSTIPYLNTLAQLKLKEKYKGLWDDIWNNNFDERGILNGDEHATINNSGYAILLDAGYQGWLNGMLTNEEFIESISRYYCFKGDPRNYRDLDDWVLETEAWDRENPGWQATPYDCYPEQVEPEAYC